MGSSRSPSPRSLSAFRSTAEALGRLLPAAPQPHFARPLPPSVALAPTPNPHRPPPQPLVSPLSPSSPRIRARKRLETGARCQPRESLPSFPLLPTVVAELHHLVSFLWSPTIFFSLLHKNNKKARNAPRKPFEPDEILGVSEYKLFPYPAACLIPPSLALLEDFFVLFVAVFLFFPLPALFACLQKELHFVIVSILLGMSLPARGAWERGSLSSEWPLNRREGAPKNQPPQKFPAFLLGKACWCFPPSLAKKPRHVRRFQRVSFAGTSELKETMGALEESAWKALSCCCFSLFFCFCP